MNRIKLFCKIVFHKPYGGDRIYPRLAWNIACLVFDRGEK